MFTIKEDIFDLNESKRPEKHRTLAGSFVEYFSPECKEDLVSRIADAIHTRDETNCRSDERIHYNGVLNVLRRKLREVEKELHIRSAVETESVIQEKNDLLPKRRTKHRAVGDDQRILRLAGIL